MFDAKVSIKRLPSFSVPKITVIRHVKPILKVAINVADPNSLMKKKKTLVPLTTKRWTIKGPEVPLSV